MVRRVLRHKRRGQSAALIAVLMVVLFAMVGLAVDVGNTYQQQRSTVRAADAAAIAGMNRVINGGSDADVAQIIRGSFQSNGITLAAPGSVVQPGQYSLSTRYLDNRGIPLLECNIGECGQVPRGTTYIKIDTDGKVETFFARIVQSNSLPVNATSYARQCAPSDNVFPVAIRAGDLNARGFIKPTSAQELKYYRTFSDATYPQQLTQRRVYIKPTSESTLQAGNFAFLRWKPEAGMLGSDWLAQAFLDRGNIRDGFAEVKPWPGDPPAPTGYPTQPTELNQNDYIAGYPQWPGADGALRANLANQILNKTVMLLPIVEKSAGAAPNTSYLFQRMGAFLLRGYSATSDETRRGGYLDLAYVGEASPVSCLTAFEPIRPESASLIGTIEVAPQWKEILDGRRPVVYMFVFDMSGSMSWNFDGWGYANGRAWQCETIVEGQTYNGQPVTDGRKNAMCNQGGTRNSPWPNRNERRIEIAKAALIAMVNKMGEKDVVRVAAYSNDLFGYKYRGREYKWARAFPADGEVTPDNPLFPGWTSDPQAIKNMIRNINMRRNDVPPELTRGGTSGANGVKLARDLLRDAPREALMSDGATREYRKVMVYVTDGVANVFQDDKIPSGAPQATNTWTTTSCPDMVGADGITIANTAKCQDEYYDNDSNQPMPIQSMIDQTKIMKAQYGEDLQIFTVALGGSDATGLDKMASEKGAALRARTAEEAIAIFEKIPEQVATACVARDGLLTDQIPPGNRAPVTFGGLRTGGEVVGWVSLYDTFGNELPNGQHQIPIKADLNTNKLSFALPSGQGLARGQYQMEAFVAYKGADNLVRIYRQFDGRNSTNDTNTRIKVDITEDNAQGGQVNLGKFQLILEGDKKVCP